MINISTKLNFPIENKKTKINIAVKKSKATIIFLLFTLSAIIPPKGVTITIGIKEHADTAPNKVADFVMSKR